MFVAFPSNPLNRHNAIADGVTHTVRGIQRFEEQSPYVGTGSGYYPRMPPPHAAQPARGAFTLMELLVTIAIIAVLAAMLLPAVGLVRERSRRTEAQMVVNQLSIACETYMNEDHRHMYPLQPQLYPAALVTVPHPIAQRAQGVAASGVLELLLESDVVNLGNRALDSEGCMLDPWLRRYRYQLLRPTPASPVNALQDWNWDAERTRPKRWNERADTPAPFPYIWSLGKDGRDDAAKTWVYDPNA